MKQLAYLIFIGLISFYNSFCQVTPNPKIDLKSAQHVFINKIEITDSYTVFHMQVYDKNSEQEFNQFMKENPGMLRGLMDYGLSKKDAEQKIKERFLGLQTISFQPASKIVLNNGQKFKFIKAVNIPVSPERQELEIGAKHFFKVYFEKIPAGFEKIDLIEHDLDTDGNFQYWNFKGIYINNPKNRKPAEESPVEEEVLKAQDFRLFGRILNTDTNEPINAKIVCVDSKTGNLIDSLQTSRTGKYEFFLNTDDVIYRVSSHGFSDLEESLNLKFFLKAGNFEKDVFLEPLGVNKTTTEVAVEEEVPLTEPSTIGEQLDEEATTFKLDKVYFNLGQAIILEESFEQLNQLVTHLKNNQDLKIQIEGHTDDQGDAKLNQKLSIDRAYNVRQYLVSKGIDTKRIKFKGLGSSKPVAANDTEENRSKNRRVEYKLFE